MQYEKKFRYHFINRICLLSSLFISLAGLDFIKLTFLFGNFSSFSIWLRRCPLGLSFLCHQPKTPRKIILQFCLRFLNRSWLRRDPKVQNIEYTLWILESLTWEVTILEMLETLSLEPQIWKHYIKCFI